VFARPILAYSSAVSPATRFINPREWRARKRTARGRRADVTEFPGGSRKSLSRYYHGKAAWTLFIRPDSRAVLVASFVRDTAIYYYVSTGIACITSAS